MIFVDGGVRNGTDVLKLLALGADAVLLSRPLAIDVFGGIADGLALILKKMQGELVSTILLTGTGDVKHVCREILAFA